MTEQLVLSNMESDSERFAAADRRNHVVSLAVRYLLLGVVGFIMLYPLIWLIGASFKTNAEIFSSPGFIPRNPTFQGYIEGWKTSTAYTFATFFWNTFLIIAPKVIGTDLLHGGCIWICPLRFSGQEDPVRIADRDPSVAERRHAHPAISAVSRHRLARYFPAALGAIGAGRRRVLRLQLVQFLRAIPRDMEEAARVDGASTWQTLIFVVVPLLTPALISVCLFQFMWSMNDFLGPLIYISSVDKYPVSLALKLSIDATEAFEWNRILAMSVLALTPSLVGFFIAQKYFIEGISAGGVKG